METVCRPSVKIPQFILVLKPLPAACSFSGYAVATSSRSEQHGTVPASTPSMEKVTVATGSDASVENAHPSIWPIPETTPPAGFSKLATTCASAIPLAKHRIKYITQQTASARTDPEVLAFIREHADVLPSGASGVGSALPTWTFAHPFIPGNILDATCIAKGRGITELRALGRGVKC